MAKYLADKGFLAKCMGVPLLSCSRQPPGETIGGQIVREAAPGLHADGRGWLITNPILC
jgi:hypothetical protein